MAVHSITYEDGLHHDFNVFGVRDDEAQVWLPWEDVLFQARAMGVAVVPVIDETRLTTERSLRAWTEKHATEPSAYGPEREGVVVRPACAYADNVFRNFTAKWVRADHVQTDEHWSKGDFIKQPRRTA
jgi:hypothetical protein